MQYLTLPALVYASCPIHFKRADYTVRARRGEQPLLFNPAGRDLTMCTLPALPNEMQGLLVLALFCITTNNKTLL